MKVFLRIIILFLFVLAFSNCTPKNEENQTNTDVPIKKTYYSVTVAIDNSVDCRIFQTAILSGKGKTISKNWGHNDESKSYAFHWDSLEEGNYSLNIGTIFFDRKQTQISISSDTILFIKNIFPLTPVSLIRKDELLSSDTVEFTYTANGCFQADLEKSILIKTNGGGQYTFQTSYGSTVTDSITSSCAEKNVSSDIIEDLSLLELNSKIQKDKVDEFLNQQNSKKQKGNIVKVAYSSTSRQDLYILANGKLFHFDDEGLKEWKSYKDFHTKYISD